MAMLASSLVTTTKRVGHLGCGHVMQSGSQCRGAEATSQLVTTNDLILVMVAFPRVRGFWENVRQFIPRLRFFF